MIQQGQVFKLKTKGPDGQALWAYRYRLEGRGSERPQVGGFASRGEAEKALRKVLDRLGPGGGRATITVLAILGLRFPRHAGLGLFVGERRFMNLGGAAGSFSALTGSIDDRTGVVVMTAGCRSPLALRLLVEIGDAQGWTDLRASRRGISRKASDLLLRALS